MLHQGRPSRFVGWTCITDEDLKMCLFLYDDPDGRPYDKSDYERALKEHGLLEYVESVAPKLLSSIWVLKMKTTEGKQTVANVRGLHVKGMYCAIVDPCLQEETCVRVHWVPFNVPNETLRNAFQRFGVVKEVIREKLIDDIEGTTRHITICLNKGIRKGDLPHLWNLGDTEVHIFIPGRPRVCLTCGGPYHVRADCPTKRCHECGEDLYKNHKCGLPHVPGAPPK